MYRILTIALLSCGFAFAASAQVPDGRASVTTAQDAAATDASAATSEPEMSQDPAPFCLRETGSRITASKNSRRAKAGGAKSAGECAPVMGRAYSGEELRRTGAFDVVDALRMLDPAVR